MKKYDIVVIGGGPGGYTAAIRAGRLGKKVAVIEKSAVGGTCLNWGCIPSKNLIHQADQYHSLKEMKSVGITVDYSNFDYAKVQSKSRDVVKTLGGGVMHLLKKNKVDLIEGTAEVTAPGQITVNGTQKVSATDIILATGSRPVEVPGFEFDEKQVLSSTGILNLTVLPKSLVILGGGAIGCEFAYVMNAYGVDVTIVESMDHCLPTEDVEVCGVLESSFKQSGIEIRTKTKANSIQKTKDNVVVSVSDASGTQDLVAEAVLVVFGRVPNTEALGLSKLGVEMEKRGHVKTKEYGKTNIAGIYAIGDITNTPALAHVATKEGENTVNYICGTSTERDKFLDENAIPSAIYCEPQVAGFGLREQHAKEKGIKFKKSTFNYAGLGKAMAIGQTTGMIKILCDSNTNEILGAHIVGHNATEIIHELLLAKSSELLPEDITQMIHAHPTMSEGILEAMLGIDGEPIHS